MRCNACWRELEGQAVTTICGHILCTEDASKMLSNDSACPVCDKALSKSHMKSLDINPSDEWINMSMMGVAPQILMKSAYNSVMFYLGQRDLEFQYKINRIYAQCRQQCETMQEKFNEKLEQLHTAYLKMAKKCQIMEKEIENLSKDKQELQEKFAEKSRQKRKLDEMYDQLRSEYESIRRSSIQPVSNFYSRPEPDPFSNTNLLDNQETARKDPSVFTPNTPGPRDDFWSARQNCPNLGGTFDISTRLPEKRVAVPIDSGGRRPGTHSSFGGGVSNPSATLRNLVLSPIKRPQLSRNRPNLFQI